MDLKVYGETETHYQMEDEGPLIFIKKEVRYKLIERGFYIVKDKFFKEMNDPYLKGNKEANRPHYYCYKEEETDLYWMIPLSSRIEK